jgi:bacterioferritin-associated ferredoxin
MRPFKVCPKCGNPSLDVEIETVRNLVKSIIGNNENWGLCTNPNCNVSYHSLTEVYYNEELKTKLWYKSNDKDVPICYCSNITREEIEFSVKKGLNTIAEIQKFTKKNITGKCREMNPTGRCCRNAFVFTIENIINSKANENKGSNNCCCCEKE